MKIFFNEKKKFRAFMQQMSFVKKFKHDNSLAWHVDLWQIHTLIKKFGLIKHGNESLDNLII